MLRWRYLRKTAAVAAVAAACVAGFAAAGALPLGTAAALASPMETEPEEPTPTTPTPDPAPDPAPTPKPAPKPAPQKPIAPTRAPKRIVSPTRVERSPAVQHAPVQTYTRRRSSATSASRHVQPKPAKRVRKKRTPAVKPAMTTTTTPTVATLPHVDVGPRAAAVTRTAEDSARHVVVIVGLALAALLFLLAFTAPSPTVRSTAAGRVLMDHQIDVVLAGIATLCLTAILFALTAP